jgi:TfoX/Sxy family transcriptional regulator of competence genes
VTKPDPSLARLEKASVRLKPTSKRMFGGTGLLAENGAMFAGVWDGGKLLLKLTDEAEREALLAAGGKTWRQKTKTGTRAMPSWVIVPEDMSARTLAAWVKRAHDAALAR